jgi:predicted RecB family nuclease
MATKITNDILESYLACKYKAYLKLHGYHGERSEYENLMRESRNSVRGVALPVLQERYGDHECLEGRPLSRRELKQGHSLLLESAFEDDRMSIGIDGLQRVSGESRIGPYHYIPVYFHEDARVGPEQRTVLGVLAYLLADLQGCEPTAAILIHGQKAEWSRLRIPVNAGRFRSLMKELMTLRESETPPARFLNKHCQICEFRSRCQNEVRTNDELSLLRTIRSNVSSRSALYT